MNNLDFIIDFDSTIVDTDGAVLETYRRETGDYSTSVEAKGTWWYDDMCPKWIRPKQEKVFTNPIFFEVLKPIEGAFDALKYFKSKGAKLIICTAHVAEGIAYKAEWIQKNMPFIDAVIYVDMNYGMDKSMIKGDLLFDDNVNNLKSVNTPLPVCFGKYTWNTEWNGLRAIDWKHGIHIVEQCFGW